MTCITILGIAIIIALSIFLKKIRKNKVVKVITNLFTILFLLGCIAGVCGVGYFAYIIVSEAPIPAPINEIMMNGTYFLQ